MTRSKFLISVAALAASIVACSKDGRDLPKSPVAPSWPTTQGSVFGHVYESVAVPVDGVVVTIIDGPFKGRSAPSDAAGVYEIRNVEGEFTLSFQKPGYATTTRRVNTADTIQVNADVTPLTPQADVSGSWTARFAPFNCSQYLFAEPIGEIAFVEFQGSIVQRGAHLDVTLSGSGLPAPALVDGSIQGSNVLLTLPAGCDDYYSTCNAIDSQPPTVVSRLKDGRYLAVSGLVSATLRDTTIMGSMSGSFTLYSAPKPPWESLGSCSHDQHQVMLTR